jgi:hypothetical protein
VASASQSEQWKWKTLYEAAVLECDPAKLPHRIAAAQKLVAERMQRLDGTVSDAEQRALLDAHNVLCDLCKMAGLSNLTAFPKASGE